MKLIRAILFSACLFPLLLFSQNKAIINGEIKNRPDSKIIYFGIFGTDWRSGDYLKVEIKDGQFNIETTFEEPYLGEIVFEDEFFCGTWKPVYFIVEEGVIDIKLYPKDNWGKNEIDGGNLKLNQQYFYLNRTSNKMFSSEDIDLQIHELDKEFKLFTGAMMSWIGEIDKEKDILKRDSLYKVFDYLQLNNLMYTSPAQELLMQRTKICKERYDWILNNISLEVNYTGLATLVQIMQTAISAARNNVDSGIDFERTKELFQKSYKPKFPKNVITRLIQEQLDGLAVKKGNKFIDFIAPDIKGNMYKLSQEIKGKVAVIDLWASWCGPCMRTSKSFIPIWEKYKDKGFTIVGVAREKNNTEAMEKAIDRLGISCWLNLVELGDKERIWAKYGASQAGGKVILVDSKGTIVATDFDAKELEEHLQLLYK